MSRAGVLWNSSVPGYREFFTMLEAEARQLGVRLESLEVHSAAALEPALLTARQQHADGLVVFVDLVTFANRREIAELAIRNRLPSVAYVRELAEAGGLLSYGANLADLLRRSAYYVDRIIKGAKPADLPVEQPTKFELVINLKTAKALGLTIPPSLLARADELIQ
jgi:putative ABC transport system substrate-binding protein